MKLKDIYYGCYDFFPIKAFFNEFVRLKDGTMVKILEVEPINLNLRNEFEKEAILISYKNFLKNLNSNVQIVIQSKRMDLKSHIEKVNNCNNSNIKKVIQNYSEYLKIIQSKSFCSKKFYLIISQKCIEEENIESVCKDLLSEVEKIKIELKRCLNVCNDISEAEIEDTLFSFFNVRLSLFNKRR